MWLQDKSQLLTARMIIFEPEYNRMIGTGEKELHLLFPCRSSNDDCVWFLRKE